MRDACSLLALLFVVLRVCLCASYRCRLLLQIEIVLDGDSHRYTEDECEEGEDETHEERELNKETCDAVRAQHTT